GRTWRLRSTSPTWRRACTRRRGWSTAPRPDLLDAPGGAGPRAPLRAALRAGDRVRRRPLLPQHGCDRPPADGRLAGPAARGEPVKPPEFDYAAPTSIAEAQALLAGDPDAKVLAGGQSLIALLALLMTYPTQLVDLRRLGLD